MRKWYDNLTDTQKIIVYDWLGDIIILMAIAFVILLIHNIIVLTHPHYWRF